MTRFSMVIVPAPSARPGNRVYTTPGERLAAKKPPQRQETAAEGSMNADRLLGVFGARRLEAAAGREHGRDAAAIEADQLEQEPLQRAPPKRPARDVSSRQIAS
jgi:hypothetical protein